MKTYKEQFDKLTEAYINNEVNPWVSCMCFVGNLLGGRQEWDINREYKKVKDPNILIGDCRRDTNMYCSSISHEEGYSEKEIWSLERMFLLAYTENGGKENTEPIFDIDDLPPINEDALFIAFDKTLDLLKEIHEAKGEVVDKPVFVRRVLQPA